MGLLGKNYIVKHGWRFRAKLIRSFVSSSWPTYLVCIRKKLKLHGTERIEREYLGQKRSWKYHNNVDHLVNLWVLGGDEGKIASEINDYIVTSQISRKFLYGTPWASLKAHGITLGTNWIYPCNSQIYEKVIYHVHGRCNL